jgi:predicted TIM-barrel fold metal-dependent hydrolase
MERGWLFKFSPRRRSLNQEPGTSPEQPIPVDRPFIDFHTHLFPTRLFRAIWSYFEEHLWPVRYQGETDQLIQTLLDSGAQRFVFSTYAHKPSMARELNRWSAEIARQQPRAIPLGTFHPLDDVEGLAREAFGELGLAGFKIHCQVQQCYPDDPGLFPAYREAERAGKICLIHCGREPEPSPFTDARRFERVLRRFPGLTFVVAHMGADEFDRYYDLLATYENLYLDTTMVFTGFLPWAPRIGGLIEFQDRILYGSDYPNIPYELTTGVHGLLALELGSGIEDKILYSNAARLLGLPAPPARRAPR